MSSNFSVRLAIREDLEDLLVLIEELAIFEKMAGQMKLTVEDLIRDGGFNSHTAIPQYVCFVAEEKSADGGSKLLGYAMCFNCYSTWQGKALLMKDLFVHADHRRRGVGRAIFTEIAKYAKDKSYKRVDFHVLNWNKRACDFYQSMGAVDLTKLEEWTFYRKTLN